jgi:hypothetical protein
VSTPLNWIPLCAWLAAFASQAAGGEAITMRVSGACVAPCDVVVEAYIEPNEHNRTVTFEMDSGNFFTRSEATLEGDRAPRAKRVRFRSLPPGKYQVRVTLFGDDGEERDYLVRYVDLL